MIANVLYYGFDDVDILNEELMNGIDYPPPCEAFKHRKKGDDNLVKEKHIIVEEDFDNDLYEEIPDNLFEALNVEANAKSLNV
jgi:hypothetical protein